MNTFTLETPYFHPMENARPAEQATGRGTELHSTYFEFRVTLPALAALPAGLLSDSELLVAAEKNGTFDFLNDPQEDGYNDLLKRE
jgi:hypothetical protein